MKQFWALTWVQVKMHMGIADVLFALRGDKKQKFKGIASLVLVLVLCAMLIGLVSFLMNWLFSAVMIPVLQQTIVAFVLLAAMVVVLLFGIFYAISLYYAKDNEFLMSLPLGKYTAFASKFTVALIGEVGTFALVVVPALVVFALHAGFSLPFLFKGILIVLLGPFIPFAVANLLAAVMMRVSVISRYKDKIAVVGGFILLAGYLFLNQYLSSRLPQMNSYDIVALMSGGLVQMITRAFPPAQWASMALVYSDSRALTGLLLFVGVSALAIFLCVFVAGRMYYRSASAQGETRKRNKRVDVSDLGQRLRHPMWAIYKKEWKTLLRSPVYAMNGLTSVVLAPLLAVVVVVTQLGIQAGGLSGLLESLNMDFNSIWVILIAAGYCYFMATLNTAAMTMYSREGEALWILEVVPVRAQSFYLGKLFCSLSISLLSVLLACAVFVLILGIPLYVALIIALLAVLATLPPLLLMVLVDMAWPRLHWGQ